MDPRLAQRMEDSDLLLAVCTRLDEPTTEGYVHVTSPVPRQTLVHVHPDPNQFGGSIGRNSPWWPIRPASAPRSHRSRPRRRLVGPVPRRRRMRIIRHPGAGSDAGANQSRGNFRLAPRPPAERRLHHSRCPQLRALSAPLPSILRAGHAGLAGLRGDGYGLPAAIAAKLTFPERIVICYAGDGCFQMTMQELGTAAQSKLGIVILVFNNGMWGTIRQHQEREYPARVFGLSLTNPDFAALVRAYGGHGETVARTEDFMPAFERALAFAERELMPALIEVQYDPNGITPDTTLAAVRDAALTRAGA